MQGNIEEDYLPFTKVKTGDILTAALNKAKADKMKGRYKRSLGISQTAIAKENNAKAQTRAKNEEMMQRYLSSMKMNSFLNMYENKHYSLPFIDNLIVKYRKSESLVDHPHLRLKVGRVNAGVENIDSDRQEHEVVSKVFCFIDKIL